MTNKALVAGALIATLAWSGFIGEAQARRAEKAPVAAARVGLLKPKSPLIGPQLVYRGGYTPLNDMVRPRFVGGMVDIYPTASGFRFSTGTRYFARNNFWVSAEQATRGLLYDPHWNRGGRGLARGFRRYTPAVTMGYDLQPVRGLVLGLEGGAINGRAIQPFGPRAPGSQRLAKPVGLNEIATLSARFAF